MQFDDIYQAVNKKYHFGLQWKKMDRKEYMIIKEDIRRVFWVSDRLDVNVQFYGSRIVGLAEKDSDLNIYVNISNFSIL